MYDRILKRFHSQWYCFRIELAESYKTQTVLDIVLHYVFFLMSFNDWNLLASLHKPLKEIQEGTVEKQSFLVAGITPEQFMQFIKFYQKLICPSSIQLRYEKIIKALLETEQHNRQWLFTTFTLSKMFVILWDVFYKAKHLKTLIKGNCKKTRNIFNNWQRCWRKITSLIRVIY